MKRVVMIGKSNVIMGQLTALAMMYGNATIVELVEELKQQLEEEEEAV